jgi:hypothetical protein
MLSGGIVAPGFKLIWSKLMRTGVIAAVLAATALLSTPSLAAGKRDTARTSIAAAKAKINLNEKNGITGEAADVQSRARIALEKAEKEFRNSEENAAIAAAGEADALADLAASTQKKQAALTTEAVVASDAGLPADAPAPAETTETAITQ